MSVSSGSDSSSSSSNSSNNENKSINVQREEMQVLKQESAISLILNFLVSQYSQFNQLSLIESSIVENSACRSLYTS